MSIVERYLFGVGDNARVQKPEVSLQTSHLIRYSPDAQRIEKYTPYSTAVTRHSIPWIIPEKAKAPSDKIQPQRRLTSRFARSEIILPNRGAEVTGDTVAHNSMQKGIKSEYSEAEAREHVTITIGR